MTVDIESIVINDRIRKDFGDLQELADDIKDNGLINPPVVTSDNPPVLIAGERRLRACKLLGWKQIEVRPMSVRDAEHQLMLEISENEVRKEFSKKERIDWARRLERIESEKAKRRMAVNAINNDVDGTQNFAQHTGETNEIVAKTLGIGNKETYRQEKYIVDHESELDPKDFADWDEGKLSTNKAFQMLKQKKDELETAVKELKAQKEAAEQKAKDMQDEAFEAVKCIKNSDDAKKYQQMKGERDEAEQKYRSIYEENQRLRNEKSILIENTRKVNSEVNKHIQKLESDLKSALARADSASEPIVETVEVEVMPSDYEELKRKAKMYDESFSKMVASREGYSLKSEYEQNLDFLNYVTNTLQPFLPNAQSLLVQKDKLHTIMNKSIFLDTSIQIVEVMNQIINELKVEVA